MKYAPFRSSYTQSIDLVEFGHEFLTDQEILNLQDAFLTNGIHYIKTATIESGRALVHSFLESLPIYTEIACLSLHDYVDHSVIDMYGELLDNNYLNGTHDLEDFFIDQCFIDFLWIEASQELLDAPWFARFDRTIHDFKLCQTMPIIIFVYENQ